MCGFDRALGGAPAKLADVVARHRGSFGQA
jgi:hypothetical protein